MTAVTNPLRGLQEKAGATFMPWGAVTEVVDLFGMYAGEYAAIRKGAAILDMPQRGVVEVRGADRMEFLHRMLTHDTRTLAAGQARHAFLLSRQGRVTADLIVLHDADVTLIDMDVADAGPMVADLEKYLFSEDVQLKEAGAEWAHVAVHGPGAGGVVKEIEEASTQAPPDVQGASGATMETWAHRRATIGGATVVVYRRDDAGVPGLHLLVPRAALVAVYEKLLAAARTDGWESAEPNANNKNRVRPIGWMAYNTARIEAGTPLFHVDFGPDSYPAETGLLDETVSFTKGCYVGQEVVARMKNLGHPKRLLVGLRIDVGEGEAAQHPLPIAGSQVLDATDKGTVIGGVTSSTLSPMLGNQAISFAVMKWGKHTPGTKVLVPAEGAMVPATVGPLPAV